MTIEILYQRSTADGLGLDTTLPGNETIDVEASCARFDEEWAERMHARYPDAIIREDDRGLRVFAGTDDDDGDTENTAMAQEIYQACSVEAEYLHSSEADLWIVD